MKKLIVLVLTLVLTTVLFAACGCTSQDAQYTTLPTSMPTMETSAPTTESTTTPTMATTEETIDRGNGPLEDNTTGSTEATNSTDPTMEGRSRQSTGTMR